MRTVLIIALSLLVVSCSKKKYCWVCKQTNGKVTSNYEVCDKTSKEIDEYMSVNTHTEQTKSGNTTYYYTVTTTCNSPH
jgi:hypothetical protein